MRIKGIVALLLALGLAAAMGGCGLFGSREAEPPEEEPELVEEEDGEYPVEIGSYTVRSRPDRVVTLSASMTEKIGDLKMEERLVGVGTADGYAYPAGAAGLPQCGTAVLPDMAVIAELEPHLVLADAEIPQSYAEALADLGIDVVVIPRAETLEQWMESYRALLRALEGAHTGGQWAENYVYSLQEDLDSLAARYGAYADANGRKTALYLRMLDFAVATGDSLESRLLDLVGLDNAAAGYTGWSLTPEEAAQAETRAAFEGVDVLFFNGLEGADGVTIGDLERSDYYKGLPAVLQDRYLVIDCTLFERQGLRMLDELERMALCEFAYPDAPPVVSASVSARPIGEIEGDDGNADGGSIDYEVPAVVGGETSEEESGGEAAQEAPGEEPGEEPDDVD